MRTSLIAVVVALLASRRRGRPDLPRAQGPRAGRRQAEGPAQDPHRLQEGLRLQDDPGRRRQGRAPATRSACATATTARPCSINGVQEALPEADRQPEATRRRCCCGRAGRCRTAFFVNDADEVTVDGFMARGYKSNGFFFTNLNGYTMNHLIASQTGVYGLYAFNTIGGSILNSEAYYVNDGAFYIGQTPPQAKPIRTIVRNVSGWGSPLGFSATNMRYVTITKSRFYNNAIGIAPNALDTEKYPPAEENVIIDNDIFWNNFNFHQGKPPFDAAQRGRRRAGADRHRHPAARRQGQPDREQPHLRQLPGRRGRRRGDPRDQDPRGAHARAQRHPEQPVRPQRHRRQRRRRRLRRQRHQQLLLDGAA